KAAVRARPTAMSAPPRLPLIFWNTPSGLPERSVTAMTAVVASIDAAAVLMMSWTSSAVSATAPTGEADPRSAAAIKAPVTRRDTYRVAIPSLRDSRGLRCRPSPYHDHGAAVHVPERRGRRSAARQGFVAGAAVERPAVTVNWGTV